MLIISEVLVALKLGQLDSWALTEQLTLPAR